jgi:PAS domain S-box-containing protein
MTGSQDACVEDTQQIAPAGGAPSPVRRLLFALAALVLLCGVCAPFFADLVDRDAPHARNGIVDYGKAGPLDAPAGLAGDWRIVWLSSGAGQPPAGSRGLIHVAGPWTGTQVGGVPLPARGAAGYQLTLHGLRPGRYILHVPSLYEAVRVSVDGRVASERGRFGLTPETSRAQVRSSDVFIDATGRDIELQIELASFHHRDNGMESAPAIGLAESMGRWSALSWMRGFLFVASALMLASYGLVVFLFRRGDRTSLYIALAALSLLPIAAIFSHDNLLLIALPHLSLLQMLSLQYLSGIAAIAFFLAYTHYLFPRESHRGVFWAIQAVYAVSFAAHAGALLVLGDTLLASQISFLALPLRVATFAYILGVVVTASFRRRDNALMYLLGASVFVGTLVTYDFLTNGFLVQDRVGADLPAIGMLVMLFSHLVILAERWTLSLDAAERANADLRRQLEVNAALFGEVESERSYNESILRSMSSGVITLDPEARVAKLNEAACRILALPAEQLQGGDVRALLSARNGPLLEEVEAVARSGQPKALLDADLTNGAGETISVNLSIVPLMSEGQSVGLLVLIEDITAGKRIEGAMRRYMTQEVLDQVLARDDLLFGDACRASVLFADIRNFTSLAETLTPRETVEMLNEIYSELFEAVAGAEGLLDKFLGDAIMAHWGAPIASERDAANSVAAALQMQARIAALNSRRHAQGQAALGLGIGVACGEVVAGAVGSPKRMDYTVIGDSVNLAARLQEITKLYRVGVVVCEATAAAVADREGYLLRELDLIRVRGRRKPCRIFEVRAAGPCPSHAAYGLGRQRLAERRWAEAVLAFEDAVVADPADLAAGLLLIRARLLQATPPPIDWDGVWDSDEG